MIWDNFHYVYQSLSGDGEIVARIVSLENTHEWAGAGVMMRERLNGNSKHAMMAITSGNGASFQCRTSNGDSSAHTAGSNVSAPYWVKLVRSAKMFTGFESSDGSDWTEVGSVTISMGSNLTVGLVVTSRGGALCTAELDNVSIDGSSKIVVSESALPEGYALLPAVPNPFNAGTRLSYVIPWTSEITLSVYDLLGQKVITLLEGTEEAGAHSAIWHGRSSAGLGVSSGAYIARLESPDGVYTTKVLLLR